MRAEKVYKLEEQDPKEWERVVERWGTRKECADVRSGKQDFYYKMTCSMCCAKEWDMTDAEALRKIKKGDRQTTENLKRSAAWCFADENIDGLWAFLGVDLGDSPAATGLPDGSSKGPGAAGGKGLVAPYSVWGEGLWLYPGVRHWKTPSLLAAS